MQSVNLGSNPGVQAWKSSTPQNRPTVVVTDTGSAPHPDLCDRLVGFTDFVSGPSDFGQGTHAAGTVTAGPASGQSFDRVADDRATRQASVIGLSAGEQDDAVEKSIRKALAAGVSVIYGEPHPPLPPVEQFLIGG